VTRLKDVAIAAGVDTSTVSKVLRGAPIKVTTETRTRIERAAQELGFRPNRLAQSLKTRRSGAIAMAVPSTTNTIYPALIDGAQAAAAERDTCLFLVQFAPDNAGQALFDLIEDGRIDGVLVADDLPEPDFLQRAIERNVSLVTLNRYPGCGAFVALDDEAGFAAQAKYLAELGHRDVAYVGIAPNSYTSQLCREAFRKEADRNAMSVIDMEGSFLGEDAALVARALRDLPRRPTAVAVASIFLATRLLQELGALGISVPEEMGVVGYHDAPIAGWTGMSTTTIRMPSREQGRRAVDRLLGLIHGESFAGETVSSPIEVVDRGSVRRLG